MTSDTTDRALSPLFHLRRRALSARAAVPQLEASDEELLSRLESGDGSAADSLFDRYAALIFSIGFRIVRDRGEAEDLVQDVFFELCRKARAFNAGLGSGRNWIIQMAYRRAFDRRVYLTRRKFYDGIDVSPLSNKLSEGGGAAMETLLDAEKLHTAFDELNENQRLTLEMFFFEGLELREIGQRLGESTENARHHYYRGLERLRRGMTAMLRPNGG